MFGGVSGTRGGLENKGNECKIKWAYLECLQTIFSSGKSRSCAGAEKARIGGKTNGKIVMEMIGRTKKRMPRRDWEGINTDGRVMDNDADAEGVVDDGEDWW